MENNNRTIVAIALIILLWSGYSLFFAPRPAPPVESTPVVAVDQQTTQLEPLNAVPVNRVQDLRVAPEDIPSDYRERLITVSTELFDIKLSTTGAVVRAVTLE